MLRKTLALLLIPLVTACSGKPPDDLGAKDGRLAPCGRAPNCVSSQAQDKKHYVPPLSFSAPVETSRRALLEILPKMPGTKIVAEDTLYLRAEFTSKTMKFVDDVEFLLDPLSNVIHVRSASRLGYSDMGVNRKRVEEIRKRLGEALEPVTRG